MISRDALQVEWAGWQREGERLAGGLNDLAQRAAVYHHLFADSGRNHAFPLIAAHGALWARRYFQFGMRMGWWLALPHALRPALRRLRLQQLARFADAFREINRRVCAETYASYHFTGRRGSHPDAAELIPAPLVEQLNRVHAARRAGTELPDAQKRGVFMAFFLHEQETVVGPRIAAAVSEFDWPLLRAIALKPMIRFAYFPVWQIMWFRDFSQREERIEKGLRAFDLAARAGWDNVAAALRHYDLLPAAFFEDSAEHFSHLRREILAGALA